MKNIIKIESDPYFICQRLREIDDSYFVVYNKNSRAFEVHSSDQVGGTFCFVVRYDDLDDRTLDYARRTRAERQNQVIEELDRENARLEREFEKRVLESKEER